MIHFPTFRSLSAAMLHLVYPKLCASCNRELPAGHNCFCLKCQLKLHPSDMYRSVENEFTNRFWGRVPLQTGAAMYYFTRKSPIQKALHQLKYKNQPEIGILIGRAFAKQLLTNPVFQSIDAIVPVPLHPKKEKLRGYNQSTQIANGLSEVLGKPVLSTALQRMAFTKTQTSKKRTDRFQNMQTVFVAPKPNILCNKHLLLVDDILTTGATLETCAQTLLDIPGVKVSMATIAIAML